jgi:hypothetical protein
MFEDKAVVDKISFYHDRLDGFTLYPNLLENGFHQNAIVVYRQCHKWPRILTFPKLSSSSVLTQRMYLQQII